MDTNSNLNNTVNLTKELDKLMSEIQNKNVQEKFPVDFESNIRVKRQSCPGKSGDRKFLERFGMERLTIKQHLANINHVLHLGTIQYRLVHLELQLFTGT